MVTADFPHRLKPLFVLLLLAGSTLRAHADKGSEGSVMDSTLISIDSEKEASSHKKRFIQPILDYFRNANKVKDFRKFDFGILPGPHYSSTAGLGLGMVATGSYTMDKKDSLLDRSNVSLYGDITTKGFMLIGIQGLNFFPKNKFRLEYRTYIYTFPTLFWGMGYSNGENNDNETEYRRLRLEGLIRFMARIAPNTYLGPIASIKYVKASEIEEKGLALFNNQSKEIHSQTVGLSFTYDSRDFMLNASKGYFVQLDQTFTPRFLGNSYCDPIPVDKAFEWGCDKVVVILTRPANYIRDPKKDILLSKFIQPEYANASEKLKGRAQLYNETLEYCKRLQAEGKVLIIAPDNTCGMDTLTKDTAPMDEFYQMGYKDGEKVELFVNANKEEPKLLIHKLSNILKR